MVENQLNMFFVIEICRNTIDFCLGSNCRFQGFEKLL